MSPPASLFGERRRRTTDLIEKQPHAAEQLRLYAAVLDLQEPVFTWVRESSWRQGDRSGSPLAPRLNLSALPWGRLERRFRHFVDRLRPHGTDVITEAGAALSRASKGQRRDLLLETVTRGDLSNLSMALGQEVALLAFYARALLQAVAEAMASELDVNSTTRAPGSCPHCGWPPQVAILRDEVETKGQRLLVCALCLTTWPVSRLGCPSCNESESDKLLSHEVADRPYLRVDECQSCKGYLKSVDLRQEGRAVALVDDLASIELDLWAAERDLWKICPNLLGY